MAKVTRYSFPENLLRRLQLRDGGCIEYTGAKKDNGYGTLRGVGRMVYAHRAMYELMIGPIPDGLVIDHLCRNRWCVNPGHMEAVTHRENLTRGNGWSGRHARATHCPQGHPYDEANTYLRPDGKGRDCRKCRTAASRTRKRKIRAES